MKIGYARASNKGQFKEDNSIEMQEKILINEGCEIIHKELYTETSINKPIFTKVLNELKAGDTLVVTKLDRFARTAVEGITIVSELINKDIKVQILNMGLVENTSTGKSIFSIMSAFAEFERDIILERTQEGKTMAKRIPGFKEGRPKTYNKDQLDHALSMLSVNGGNFSYTEVVEKTNISKSTLIREVKFRKAEELKRRDDAIAKAKEIKKQGGVGPKGTKLSHESDDGFARLHKQSEELIKCKLL